MYRINIVQCLLYNKLYNIHIVQYVYIVLYMYTYIVHRL